MPILKKPRKLQTLILPQRQAQLAAETDVLVVGGGPAGIGAALGAAQSGVKVILVERYGFLGGNATAALVMPLMSFHTHRPQFVKQSMKLWPHDHGPGTPVIAGALKRFLEKLDEKKGAILPSLDTGYVVPFDPEVFKLACLELLDQAGVEMLFHAFATDTIGTKKCEGVVFATKSGPIVIKAKSIVDCTGDGDIAALSGASFDIGRTTDQLVQPMTLMARIGEFQKTAFDEYVKKHPDQWKGVSGLWELIQKATQDGKLDLPREDILFFGTPYDKEVSVNSTRVTKVLGTDVWDLSYAEWKSRQQISQIVSFLKCYVPGFSNSYMIQSGVQVGVRETRRIIGEYILTADDILNAKKFDDVIARGSYPIDIHNPNGIGTFLKNLPPDEAYDIPLRCLIPQNTENLLVAGRCISGTHEAHSSYRVMPISMATGQAAGVCAALSARLKKSVRDVPFKKVQEELINQGANLDHSRKITRKMTNDVFVTTNDFFEKSQSNSMLFKKFQEQHINEELINQDENLTTNGFFEKPQSNSMRSET